MMIDQATKLRELVNKQKADQVFTKKIPVDTPVKRAKKGRIVAVTSGKGGVGKTNFVINLALTLSRQNKKVVVVDLDLGLANIDIILNVTPKYNMEDYIRGDKALKEILIEGPKGISVLPGGSGTQQLADLGDEGRQKFIDGFIRLVEEFDYVLLDTGAGISKNVIEFVLIAHDVIVVTTPEPTAITDAYAAIKIIAARSRESRIFLLFNMVKSPWEAKSYFKKVSQVIRQFLQLEVVNLGYIMTDSCVKQAIMKRKPFVLAYPFSEAAKCFHAVTKRLLASMPQNQGEKWKFLTKLHSVFKVGVIRRGRSRPSQKQNTGGKVQRLDRSRPVPTGESNK